jgi:hypothetical protein
MHTTIRSRSAVVLGVIFAIATAAVLLWDIRSLSDVTPDHFTTLGTLLGTIAAGHFFGRCVADRQWLYATGLALAFCAGTFICVTGSAGRGGEAIVQRSLAANKVNDARKQTTDELVEARARRTGLITLADKECAGGEGAKCKGARSSVSFADSHIAILQARLDGMSAEQIANVKLKKAAEVITFIFNADRERTEHGLELLWPFANALIWELLTIVFLGLGLGHKQPAAVTAPKSAPPRDGLVTIADIAKAVGVSPNKARSILRSHGIAKPTAGWAFETSDVARIKALINAPVSEAQHASLH